MNGNHNFIIDAIRWVFSAIDWVLFSLLGWVYEIFFDVTTVEFLSGETIKNFVGRVQLILGVLVLFKLTISILQAIVNPDMVSDKNNGFSAIIKRVVICLVMLTMLVPINIPSARNEYERQLNNNGLLFGTLYSLQSRIMANNTLGKLILGTNSNSSTITVEKTGNSQAQKMKAIKDDFVSAIIAAFVPRNDGCDGDDITSADSFVSNINSTCGSGYTYKYYPILGGICAAAFTVILIGFILDITVRAMKLAVLRLIAPVPIISYLDPNQEKKGAFANWVKMLTATYLDLFIRLAIVFFVIFLISDIRQNGVVIGVDDPSLINKGLVFIAICFGLFFFAKQAPKFIKDALGLQGMTSNIGLGAILGGTAMALGGGGLTGFAYGAMNGAKAESEAATSGKPIPLGDSWAKNRDLMAKIRTGDKDAQGDWFGRAQDYMNFQTRERNARRLGIGAQDLADAKYIADKYEDMMLTAQGEMEDAKMKYQHNPYDEKAKAAYDAANAKYTSYAQAYEKAKKRYDGMDKTRGQLGVAPTAESVREIKPLNGKGETYKGGNYRSPLKTKGEFEFDPAKLPQAIEPFEMDDQIKASIEGHKRDTNGFEGTIDDSFGSGSHGTGSSGNNSGGNTPPPPPPSK